MHSLYTRSCGVSLFILFICAAILVLPQFAGAASKTRPSIKITAPASKDSFAKQGAGIIPIEWSAKNVPANTLVILELDLKKAAKDSIGGGGTWQHEQAMGDSTGSYNWDIEGGSAPGAGTYRVRALLQECLSGGCNLNPFFPGVKKTKTYAKSKWVNITITNSAKNESEQASRTVDSRPTGPVSVSLLANGSGAESLALPSGDIEFLYFPGGDVQSCDVVAYYQGGKRTLTQTWKNGVESGSFGRFYYSAVDAYPYKSLQSVEVICGNAKYRATDTVQFSSNSGASQADYKILIGKSGSSTFKKGTSTEADAKAYCSQAYNDPDIHKYTRVQCYWDGKKFEDVDSFKG